MKKSKISPSQIAQIIKEFDEGKSVEEVSRKPGIKRATFYQWYKRYGGMKASDLKRLKEFEEENARLKRIYANLAMELDTAKNILK